MGFALLLESCAAMTAGAGLLKVPRELGGIGARAVEIRSFLVPPPDDFPEPHVPRGPGLTGAIDVIRSGLAFQRNGLAAKHRAVEFPDVVRQLQIKILGLKGLLDQTAIE